MPNTMYIYTFHKNILTRSHLMWYGPSKQTERYFLKNIILHLMFTCIKVFLLTIACMRFIFNFTNLMNGFTEIKDIEDI